MSGNFKNLRFISKSKDQNTFFSTVNKRVNTYFKENKISKKANAEMVVKTIVLLLVYIVPFIIILFIQPATWISYMLWAIMGLGMAGVGMSIMHDANHGAYSKSKKVNKFLGYTINLVGAVNSNWRLQHNLLHHTYTNITGWDEDIDTKGVLKLSPHKKKKSLYKLQWLYAILIYSIATLYWAVLKDFIQFFKYGISGINTNSRKQKIKTFIGIIITKVTYFFVFLVMPVIFFNIAFAHVISGFLIMHVVCGIVLTLTFQLAHTVEGTDHPLPDDKGNINNAWAVHQMMTTVNFARKNRFINWYVGGLNFQVEHHLFSNICHVHYPKIAPIVKKTAEEHGVPYNENETLKGALTSHFRLLRKMGKLPNLNEAIG